MTFGIARSFPVLLTENKRLLQRTSRSSRRVSYYKQNPFSQDLELFQNKLDQSDSPSSEFEEDDGWGDRTSRSSFVPAVIEEERKRVTKEKGDERDMFIPIFSLVSLAGLFGAYGYEMVRLYLRGELYLPWNQ